MLVGCDTFGKEGKEEDVKFCAFSYEQTEFDSTVKIDLLEVYGVTEYVCVSDGGFFEKGEEKAFTVNANPGESVLFNNGEGYDRAFLQIIAKDENSFIGYCLIKASEDISDANAKIILNTVKNVKFTDEQMQNGISQELVEEIIQEEIRLKNEKDLIFLRFYRWSPALDYNPFMMSFVECGDITEYEWSIVQFNGGEEIFVEESAVNYPGDEAGCIISFGVDNPFVLPYSL